MEFAWALQQEAEQAEAQARSDAMLAAYGAPFDWQNPSVSSYLGAVVAELQESEQELTWSLAAELLWLGKIME